MKKILLFYGSDRAFSEMIPKRYKNLSSVAAEMDEDGKKFEMVITGLPQQETQQEKPKKLKVKIANFVINADEYNSVQEHVITNFINFIAKLDITNMYIQNPPLHLLEQLNRVYGDKDIIQNEHQKYSVLTADTIRKIYSEYDSRILGQEKVKELLLKSIYPVMDKKQSKPVVILFYGDSGLGKTETVQYITKILGGSLFRKQFSMYQNNEFANYLFGGKYNEKSFAKDLLARDSNVILLDEFDKANPLFHSAFYQLFDEGIYVDHNYKVDMKSTLIFCTSNYQTLDEVKEKLGFPIYNRFDAIIKFSSLPLEAKRQIAVNQLEKTAKGDELPMDIREKLIDVSTKLSNAREIHRLVKDTVSLYQVQKICKSGL
ncbi:MAG: AAA family ATPase [Erysipelotrichaceae bacterium]